MTVDLSHLAALPAVELPPGERLVRIHGRAYGPLWFGPATRRPQHRFDDPLGQYKVCYLGRTLEASFVETILHDPPVAIVSLSDLATRLWTVIEVTRILRLAQMHSEGLARLGASSAITGGPYRLARPWARALWTHPSAPDGIEYRSSHDDATLSVALFDRARDALRPLQSQALGADRQRLAGFAARWGFAVDPD